MTSNIHRTKVVRIARASSLVEVRLLWLLYPGWNRSEPGHVIPMQTNTCMCIQTQLPARISTDRSIQHSCGHRHQQSHPVSLSDWSGWRYVSGKMHSIHICSASPPVNTPAMQPVQELVLGLLSPQLLALGTTSPQCPQILCRVLSHYTSHIPVHPSSQRTGFPSDLSETLDLPK